MAIAMLCAIPVSLCAQAKPKRDVKKDVASTQKAHGKKKHYSSKRNNKVIRKTKKTSSGSYSKRDETYLTVDYTDDPRLYIGYESRRYIMTVQTNSSDWTCGGGNSWFSVYKRDDIIEVYVNTNETGEDRGDFFWVSSGDKKLWVYLKQKTLVRVPIASINNVHIEHGKEIMTLSVQFNIKDAKGKACFVECRLMDANGRYVCDNRGEQIIRYSDYAVTPQSYNENISIPIHITNNFIPVGREEKLFIWMIVVSCDNHYIDTTYKRFFAKKWRGNVETKD